MAAFDTAPYTPRFEDNIPDSTGRRLDQWMDHHKPGHTLH